MQVRAGRTPGGPHQRDELPAFDAGIVGHDDPRQMAIAGRDALAVVPNPVNAAFGLLGLSMIAGSPLWFFLIELIVFNVVLVIAIMQAAASGRRIARLIAQDRQ